MGPYSKTEQLVRFAIFFGYSYWLFLLYATGGLNYFVHSRFHYLALVTASVMLLLALTQLAGIFSADTALVSAHEAGCCGQINHKSSHKGRQAAKKVLTYLVFIIPLLFGIIPPSGLDPAMAEKKGFEVDIGYLQETASEARNLEIDNNFLEVDNHNYTLLAEGLWGNPHDLEGVEVNALGFLYQPSWYDLSAEQFILGRYLITCCAADALINGFLIVMPAGYTANEFDWVQIKGTVILAGYQGEVVGAVIVEVYEVVDQPSDPYLFY